MNFGSCTLAKHRKDELKVVHVIAKIFTFEPFDLFIFAWSNTKSCFRNFSSQVLSNRNATHTFFNRADVAELVKSFCAEFSGIKFSQRIEGIKSAVNPIKKPFINIPFKGYPERISSNYPPKICQIIDMENDLFFCARRAMRFADTLFFNVPICTLLYYIAAPKNKRLCVRRNIIVLKKKPCDFCEKRSGRGVGPNGTPRPVYFYKNDKTRILEWAKTDKRSNGGTRPSERFTMFIYLRGPGFTRNFITRNRCPLRCEL